MGSIGFNVGKQCIERDAFPGSAEFGPPCDAMNINRECLSRQITKRLPIPSPQLVSTVIYFEFPLVQRHMRRRSRRQDREVSSDVLPWWQLLISLPALTRKTS